MDSPEPIEYIEINIKNINNYEIYFHKCIMTYNTINVYEGRNIKTKEKIIVEVYNTDIIFLAKRIKNKIIKIEHPNIIIILDIIIEFSNIFIIKPYYKMKIIDVNINNFIKLKQIMRGIKYLFDKNIDIEQINIDNIYYDEKDNLVKLSPFLSPPLIQKNILYGSPLYSPPEFLNINKSEREITFILFLKTIFYKICLNNSNIDDNLYINKIYKHLLCNNDINNCSLIEIYYYFEKSKHDKYDKNDNKENLLKINNLNDEMFIMEM
jgi:hypothetical protein